MERFCQWSDKGMDLNVAFEIVKRNDGVLTLRRLYDLNLERKNGFIMASTSDCEY